MTEQYNKDELSDIIDKMCHDGKCGITDEKNNTIQYDAKVKDGRLLLSSTLNTKEHDEKTRYVINVTGGGILEAKMTMIYDNSNFEQEVDTILGQLKTIIMRDIKRYD